MNTTKTSTAKKIIKILLILILHAAVVFISICGYKYYESRSMERDLKKSMGDTVDETKLAGSVFEYDLEYTLSNGESKQISGKEVYYWDGNSFVPVSEFMK